jgi:hypothetical protein
MLGTKGLRSLDLCPDAVENNQHGYLLSEAKKIDVFIMYTIHFRTFSKLKNVFRVKSCDNKQLKLKINRYKSLYLRSHT